MSPLQNIELTVINGKPITTSRQIAHHFEKRHKNVLQSIENLDCSPQFNRLNFQPVKYQDDKGESRKEYQITRDGFMYLVMGFTGKRAAVYKEAYIYAFNDMEQKLHDRHQTVLHQGKPKINDILHSAIPLEKVIVEISYTKQGDVVNVNELESPSDRVITKKASTVSNTASWQLLVEAFFAEIENGGIPEEMRQNILLAKEPISTNEQHDCLFFRLSNLMAFFRKTSRLSHVMQESTIQTAPMLLKQLKAAGVLAFDGKTKEKGIPTSSNVPADKNVRRVSHLVALDLVILERDYGLLLLNGVSFLLPNLTS